MTDEGKPKDTDQDGSTGFSVELLNLDSSTRLSDIEELLYSLETAVVEGRIGIKEGERVLEEVWAAAFPASPVEGRFGSLSLVDSMSLETRDMPSGVPDDESRSLIDAIRDAIWLVRIAATTTRRVTRHSLWSGVRTGARMVGAAGTARSMEEFVNESQEIAFDEMDRLGVDVDSLSNGRKRGSSSDDPAPTAASLRERGARLLEMSADVEHDESIHPAYPHILDQLAPDEARILRFLVTDGPQPVVNVRDVGWIPFSSDLVAAGLSMVGTEAGCRHEDRTQAYLNNLERLGLVWFSDEPVEEIDRYQLVEAQPDVKGAIDSCSRPKVVRRSIHLTPFGVDFCKVCLPVDTISEDAAGVYNVPEDRTTGEKDVRRNRGGDRNRSRDATDWRRTDGTPDDIRNPHVDDHWD